jgi:hypothetical protein
MKRLSWLGKCSLVVLTVACLGFMTTAAKAGPFSYTFTGAGVSGGVVNGVTATEFNDASFRIDLLGDTGNVVVDSLGPLLTTLTGTMTLFGGDLGSTTFSGSFTDLLYLFTDIDLIGFGIGDPNDPNVGGVDLLDYFFNGIDVYDLKSPIGPIPADSVANMFDANMTFGALVLDDVVGGTFTATPEPATMLLLGTGLAGLVGSLRKKRLTGKTL